MKLHHDSGWQMAIAAIIAVSICSGCHHLPTQRPATVRALDQKVSEGKAKRDALQAQYKRMQVSELSERLEKDSGKGVEPFNSAAYREVVSRGQRVGRQLASLIRTNNQTSFLSLLAVRKIDQAAYRSIDNRSKTLILIDALRASKYFNTWGLPHLYWEEPAKAVIELRDGAVESLKALLKDKRAAPVWGSEEAMEYSKYKYRVCDYAWALLMEIQAKKVEIPSDPALRDDMITRALEGRN